MNLNINPSEFRVVSEFENLLCGPLRISEVNIYVKSSTAEERRDTQRRIGHYRF
jgi:hypothetical protein